MQRKRNHSFCCKKIHTHRGPHHDVTNDHRNTDLHSLHEHHRYFVRANPRARLVTSRQRPAPTIFVKNTRFLTAAPPPPKSPPSRWVCCSTPKFQRNRARRTCRRLTRDTSEVVPQHRPAFRDIVMVPISHKKRTPERLAKPKMLQNFVLMYGISCRVQDGETGPGLTEWLPEPELDDFGVRDIVDAGPVLRSFSLC